jgi:hypothetical protein
MPDQTTPLDTAIAEVIAFARQHGVDAVSLEPRDFGHQLIGSGYTTVTYVDGDHVIAATIDRYGYSTKCVGRVEWIHNEADEDREPCAEYCGECHACGENPCECPADAPDAYRDDAGYICRRSDGTPIVSADLANRSYIESCLALWADCYDDHAVDMRGRYQAALALLDREEAAANA